MTDVLPSALPNAAAWSNADEIIMSQDGGATLVKGTNTQLLAYVGGASPVTGAVSVANMAAARALSSLGANSLVLVLGYWNAGDGGGGTFWFDNTDHTTAEDYAMNIVTATAISGGFGRLKRMAPTNAIDVRWFGALWNDASHTLSSLGFATLAAAQAVYPEAQALTDEVDGCALQRAINWVIYNPNGKWTVQQSKFAKVMLPAGRGFSSNSIVVGYGLNWAGGNYSAIIIEGQGSCYAPNFGQLTGTTIYFNALQGSFGFGCQGNIRTSFREVRVDGLYTYLAGLQFGTNGEYSLGYYVNPAWAGVVSGTAQAGGSNTITLASGTTQPDNYFNGLLIFIKSGTGAGQMRTINGYVASTKVATVSAAWTITPDNTSVYVTVTEALYRNVAICVDPFTTVAAFPSGIAWAPVRLPPELGGGVFSYGDGTGLYNSDGVNLFNVTLAFWWAGFGRVGGDSNAEWNCWEGQNSGSSYVILPMLNTGSQSRQPVANGVKFQNFFTAINGTEGLNPNIGNVQATFKDCHFGFGIRLVDAVQGWAGPVKFDGCYAESVAFIGTAETVTLDNTLLSLRETDIQYGGVEAHLFGDLVMQGGAQIIVDLGLFVVGNVACFGSNITIRSNNRTESDLAVSATSTTIKFSSGANSADSYYNGMAVYIQTGTGKGQVRTISSYVGATRTATVPTWTTTPDATSVYITGMDVTGWALALASGSRGGMFATGNVELYAHDHIEAYAVSRDHSTQLEIGFSQTYPPTQDATKSPNYWVHPYQTSSSSAAYRRTYEAGFFSFNHLCPLVFDNAAVPNVIATAQNVAVRARNGRDLTCDRLDFGNGVKADIGDTFALASSNPNLPTWFICIAISTDGLSMYLRQISNYYRNWYGPTLYAPIIGTTTAEIAASTAQANSVYYCARVFDISMYGYVGTINNSGQSIANLKNGSLGTNTFNYPDRSFPAIAGDTLIITDNSDAWLNAGGAGFARYWPVVSITQATATMVLGSGTLPATGTVVKPKFFIRNFTP